MSNISQNNQFQNAYLTTSNDTETTIASISVPELQAKTIFAVIVGSQDDKTEGCGGFLNITARRAAAGNVTIVGAVNKDQQADAGSFTADVDTGTQTIRIRVTGVAAETWNWQVRFIVTGV